jgi:dTDP-4-amino-4,6-dideoxygalactose transaminase
MNRNTDFIPFAQASLDYREEEAVTRVIRSGWLTTAGEALAFEKEFASSLGVGHALAVNSGTAGLHLALDALGVGPGDRVITTPYTFTSSAEVARYLGADPLFVDVRDEDCNIDPDQLERALKATPRTKAVIPVHVGGHPCRMDRILEVATGADCAVVEDAAHAFGASWQGRPLGTWGAIGVFSFYATKPVTCGEGGMVITDDPGFARRITLMRLHGIDRDVWNRYSAQKPSWEYGVVAAGYKYNLSDLLAAIGRVQLTKSAVFRERRKEIARTYTDLFSDRDYLRTPMWSDESSWHLYVMRIRPERLSISRDEYINRLAKMGIGTSVHYIPLHIMPYYRDRYDLRPDDFPVSLSAYRTAISLPVYPTLTDEQVSRVADAVMQVGDSALCR